MSKTEKIPESTFEKISEEANEVLLVADKPRLSFVKRFLIPRGLLPFRVETESSSLAWIRYNKREQTLDVAFRESGAAYRYFAVSPKDVIDLVNAPSIGRQFNLHLRNDFKYQVLNGPVKPSVAEQKTSIVAKTTKSKKAVAAA